MQSDANAISLGPARGTHVASQHSDADALRCTVSRSECPSPATVVGARDGATSQVSASKFNSPTKRGEQHATPQHHSIRCMKDRMPQTATVSAVSWGMLVFVKEKKPYGTYTLICPDRTGR